MSIAESYSKNLPEDEALHEHMYDLFPGLVYLYDLDQNKFRFLKGKIKESLGFSGEDLNDDFEKVIFKDDVPLVRKELKRFLELSKNDLHTYHCRLNRKDGDYLHFHVTGKVLRYHSDGKPASILFVAQDIHDHVLSVEAAQVSLEVLNDSENLLRFATWKWDIHSNEVTWSRGICALLNYNSSEYEKIKSGNALMNFVLGEDKKRLDQLYADAVASQRTSLRYEYTIETHDQELKELRTRINFRYADGQLVSAFGISKDITEESSMLNGLLGYRQMMVDKERFLAQGSWEINLKTNVASWSDGMYTLFGYDPQKDRDHLVINEELYRRHLNAEDFARGKELRKAALESDNSYVWDYQITTVSSETKRLETFGKIIRDTRGRAIRVIGATHDVTKRVDAARELEQKVEELKQSNKNLEDFVYIASHDMHEPLRKVHSFADRLKTKFGNTLEEEAAGYLDRILTATLSARLMIDGLLEFSRLSTRRHWFEKVDLNNLVAEIIRDLELSIEETHATIRVGPLPEINVIRIQMKQLITNILSNAIKFRKTGSSPVIDVESKILTSPEAKELGLDGQGVYYKIAVRDNGIGFEPEYSETVFQMFHRLNSKSEYPGSGIGLALCKKIAENHLGVINASSEPGQGTVISVIVPSNSATHV